MKAFGKGKEYLRTILRQAERIEALEDTVEKLQTELRLHRSAYGVRTPALTYAEQIYSAYKRELRRLSERGEPVGYEELMAVIAQVRSRSENT